VRIAALLLAAGEGRRIGGCKALLEAGGTDFLEACARLLGAAVEEVIAVTGAGAERVEARARELGLVCVRNPRPRDGMLASLRLGLEAAGARGAGAVLVHPVDHPLVAPETAQRVADALRAGARIAVPSWEGRRGHPGGFAACVWDALRAAPEERGARAVLAEHPDWIVHVAGDPGCRAGVDTPQDYARRLGGPVRRR